MQIFTNKPKAIVIDMMSTAVKAGFIEKALYRFLRNHGLEVIQQKWGEKDFMETAVAVRRQVRQTAPFTPNMPPVADKKSMMEEQQTSLYQNMIWMIDNGQESDAHYKLKYVIYVDGYDKGRLFTHVYSDVARNAHKWKEQGIRVYLFSHAWVVVQKLFMAKTNHDSLSPFIDGYFDNQTLGKMEEANSFKMLLQRIQAAAPDVIFLTKGIAEGRAAKEAGIHSILVISHRHQMGRYDKQDLQSFERIRSFVSSKRNVFTNCNANSLNLYRLTLRQDELLWKGEPVPTVPAGSQSAETEES